MKKLLMLPLLVLLTGCVTYYYPQTALEDGVYYAEDDPSHAVYSDAYAGAPYYPWSSLDYFYLGFNPYPSYGFGYGSGFSAGISYGYSPWYYRYSGYGYYSPRYTSHYRHPYYAARRPYNRYYSPTRRYVSTAPSGYSGNQGMVIRSREATKTGKNRLQPDSRARRAGNEVRRSSNTKQTRSRTHPVESSPSSSRQRESKGDSSSHREQRE